jgi:predicted AAA+ superfamily ATPase
MSDTALSFEQIRDSFRELREYQAETTRQIEKTDKIVKKLSKQMGGLHNSMGELIETLIAPHLWEKFGGYPYNLCRGYQRVMVYDDKNKELTEIDILLSDTEWCMAVEVKRELRIADIDRHIVRMGRILRYPPAETVGKKLLGALAGGVVGPDVHEYAHIAGFFVLELRGDNVSLVPPPAGFSPKIW